MRSYLCALSLVAIFFLQASSVYGLNYRLDTHVVPEIYNISIKPYLLTEDGAKQFTFDGEVQITLHATIPDVQHITLHQAYLEITDIWLYDLDGNLTDTPKLSYESETNKLTVQLQESLIANVNYTLHFKYNGQIHDDPIGFYRTYYTNADGIPNWIGMTQMQTTHARTVLPCFDEPAFKARFLMCISRPKEYNSIFNTKLLRSAPDGEDRVTDYFAETPPMSTYLIAFVVSHFTIRGDTEFFIMTHPVFLPNTKFSYDVSRQILRALDEYTKLPYKTLGIDTLQNVFVPKGRSTCIANWGLVICDEDSLFMMEPCYTGDWTNKEKTITSLMHVTVQMWFGGSVTHAWWNSVWLSGAFASYYQYFLAHELYPKYQLDQQFVVNELQMTLCADAINTAQPMTSPASSIQTPADIGNKLSLISYAKGASILRMIRNLMGVRNFDNAINQYLAENHLRSTVPNDLFQHLKRHWPTKQKVDLDQFFYDWTEQVGFPLLNVTVSTNGHRVDIVQQRFLLNPLDGRNLSLRYTTPITYTTNLQLQFNKLMPKFYFKKSNRVLVLTFFDPINWIILNLQQSNYYRVLYDTRTLREIQKALSEPQHSGFHVANRAQLIDDLFNCGHAGLLDYDVVFKFMEYLAHETEYLPWRAAFVGMHHISKHLPEKKHQELSRFLFKITHAVYAKLGFHSPTDTVLDVYNRNMVVSWLCRYGHPGCNREAQAIFLKYNETSTKPSPDFRETLYCSAVRNGDFTFYETLKNWYEQETLSSEQELLLRSMGCTRKFYKYHYDQILSAAMPYALKLTALKPLYTENSDNLTAIFTLFTSSIEDLAEALDGWSNAADVISEMATYFTNTDQLQLLQNFIDEHGHKFGDSIVTLQNGVKTTEQNLAWSDQHMEKLFKYLELQENETQYSFNVFILIVLLAFYHFLVEMPRKFETKNV